MIFTVINIGTGYLNRSNWLLAGYSVYHRVASQGFPAGFPAHKVYDRPANSALAAATVRAGRPQCLWQAQILTPAAVRACVSPGPPAKLFIPLQFRTPVRTHLHTANQRPRVLICIQPINRGWFNPRYKLVRPPLLPSTARGAVGKATCSTALHLAVCKWVRAVSDWLYAYEFVLGSGTAVGKII